jgi:hypothetical protein
MYGRCRTAADPTRGDSLKASVPGGPCHIAPHAAILVQEVVNTMASAGNIASVAIGMHVHPALPELVLRTLNNLHAPE